jgi:hypothetical protein
LFNKEIIPAIKFEQKILLQYLNKQLKIGVLIGLVKLVPPRVEEKFAVQVSDTTMLH